MDDPPAPAPGGGGGPAGGAPAGAAASPDAAGKSAAAAGSEQDLIAPILAITDPAKRNEIYLRVLEGINTDHTAPEYRAYLATLNPEQRKAQYLGVSREHARMLKSGRVGGGIDAAKEREYQAQLSERDKQIKDLSEKMQKAGADKPELPEGFEDWPEAEKQRYLAAVEAENKRLAPVREFMTAEAKRKEAAAQQQIMDQVLADRDELAPFLGDTFAQVAAVLNSSLPEGQQLNNVQMLEEATAQFYDSVKAALTGNDPGIQRAIEGALKDGITKASPWGTRIVTMVQEHLKVKPPTGTERNPTGDVIRAREEDQGRKGRQESPSEGFLGSDVARIAAEMVAGGGT
jgi:hypothetical protein